VVFDEAMILAAAFMAALVPTMAARSMDGDPQLWFAGSAVDQEKTEHGIEFARVRADALAGVSRLAYFGWNIPYEHPDKVPAEVFDDPEAWALANPGLGIRIAPEYVADERRALGDREFAVERLGVGDWPALVELDPDGIQPADWEACEDSSSEVQNPVEIALDVRPTRSHSAIAVSGLRADGLPHIEVIEHKSGTNWVAERVQEVQRAHKCGPVLLANRSPAMALVPQLVQLGVQFRIVEPAEQAQGCGVLFDLVKQREVRHRGQSALNAAVRGVVRKPAGEAWMWSRMKSEVDISPLVAATLALWAVKAHVPVSPRFEVLA
jgi:hypothetical protein